MDDSDSLVIVGAGNAGAELAVTARQQGWLGTITLLGDETHLPYHRPPLSKGYLSGKTDADALAMRPVEAYEKSRVTLRLGTRVAAIDRAAKVLRLADGHALEYTRLALCLGARPRLVTWPGMPADATPANLHYLRTRGDADAMRASLVPGARVVVIGGGYVGLEVAASARGLGADATILEMQPRVLARVTGPEVSAFYEQVHRAAGVDLRTGVRVEGVQCDVDDRGRAVVRAVVLAGGERIAADVLVVGIGGVPNVELAEAAGLAVEDGIVVDEFGQTSDPHIYAAGDCSSHPSRLYGRRLRLESVPNALEQSRTVAAAVCGISKPYDSVPWFWSDQYDLKLQMVGLAAGHDRFVLRGSMASRSFTAFYLKDGRPLAIDVVNRPVDFMMGKKLVAAAAVLDPDRLADESVALKSLLVPAG